MSDTTDDAGRAVTVNGRIDPEQLGTTLTHEHVFVDFSGPWYDPPDDPAKREIAESPVSIENLWYVQRNGLGHRDNLRMDEYDVAVEELGRFREAGGDTIVDVTPKGVDGDPERVRDVANETGVQFVHGTAIYVRSAHPDRVDDASIDELADEFVSDVETGIGDTDVRAGIVGEIGLSDLIHDQEEKVLRAGARAARRTGAPLSVHPPGRSIESQRNRTYPSSRWGLDVLDIVEEEDLPPERVVIDHMDRTMYEDLSYQRRLADRGAYIEYDMWGAEDHLERYEDSYPSDFRRVQAVSELIEEGYADSLLFSHDVGSKASLTKYGGFGYAHVLDNVVPMLDAEGVSADAIESILVDNPRDLLTFV